MRVLFIYPSFDCPPGTNHGLMAMSGNLRRAGHEARLLYLNEAAGENLTPDQVVERVREERPGLVGFSLMSQQAPWAYQVARRLREELPELPLAAGGVHCTMVPDEVVETGLFDWVFPGEADNSIVQLVDALAKGGDTSRVPGTRIPARNGQSAVHNPLDPYPQLDTLLPLDWELFDLEHITRAKNGWLGLITSRGCPYRCSYCFNKEIVDLYQEEGASRSRKEFLRHFPVEPFLEELRGLVARYPGVNTLIIDDDLFTLNRDYVLEWTEAYRRAGIGLPYVVNAHVQRFDDTTAWALKRSGCMICKIGLESGSDTLRRDVLLRVMSNAKIEEAFQNAHNYDLHTSAFVMIGLPGESIEQIRQTISLVARIKMGRFRWAIFFPFPGTAGYRIAMERGLVDRSLMEKMGNYFDASCLTFGEAQDLLIEKLSKLFVWWVNAETDWPCAPIYRELVQEVEALTRAEWETRCDELVARERELSDELLASQIVHYSIRYSHVMGVRSDFLRWDQERLAARERAQAPVSYTLD